jgi:ZIP family zinc transporter
MWEAFAWGAFAGSSLLLGALIVKAHVPRSDVLGLIMGFGAGVLLSAVSFELVEEAVTVSGGLGGTGAGFFAGAVVFFLGDRAIASLGYRDRKDIDGAPQNTSPLSIVLGTVLDGVPESAVLGLTLLTTGEVGASMLVAVFISNLPESIAASSSLRSSGWPERDVYLLWAGIAVVCGISAAAGYGLLDGAAPQTLAFVLAFAGGAILAMLSTTMMPEAYEHAGRIVGLATTAGFAVAFVIAWLAE